MSDEPTSEENPDVFKRFRTAKSRAARACQICHMRKVRCDVTSRMPCTNCAAFGCECKLPESKPRKNSALVQPRAPQKKMQLKVKMEDGNESTSPGTVASSAAGGAASGFVTANRRVSTSSSPPKSNGAHASGHGAGASGNGVTSRKRQRTAEEISATLAAGEVEQVISTTTEESILDSAGLTKAYEKALYHKWKSMADNRVSKSSSAGFFGSTSNIGLLVDQSGQHESFHYSMSDDNATLVPKFDMEDVNILKVRGAFLLPSRELCDDLVETFFEKVAPHIPVVNRSDFMRDYNDPLNPPSLLLLQSMLLAASRLSKNPALLNEHSSSLLASMTFYKRAKALYDANYESDRVAVVQSLILLSWWWDDPEEITRNMLFWLRTAIAVAHGFGMHRQIKNQKLSQKESRMWRRVWWCLFVRDRMVACAIGRPMGINIEDTDVEMLTEEDFVEGDDENPSLYPINKTEVQYFIQLVKLSEIMGIVIKQQFTVGAERSRKLNRHIDASHCDKILGLWMNTLPSCLQYSVKDRSSHNFYAALLHMHYYAVLCLVHRSNLKRKLVHLSGVNNGGAAGSNANSSLITSTKYPSWGIAFQAAHMIVQITEVLVAVDELKFAPAFAVYCLFSATIVLQYQRASSVAEWREVADRASEAAQKGMANLAQTWPIARTTMKLFEFVRANRESRAAESRAAKGEGVPSQSTDPTSNNDAPPGSDAEESNRSPSIGSRTQLDQQVNSNGHQQSNGKTSVTGPAATSFERHQSRPQAPPPPLLNQAPHRVPSVSSNPSTVSPAHDAMSPELFTVTNPTSGHATQTFFNNFQPHQLFPEVPESWSKSEAATPQQVYEPSAMEAAAAAAISTVPNSMNAEDWYEYVLGIRDTNATTAGL